MITTLIFDFGGVLTVGKYTHILEALSKERQIDIEECYSDFDKLIVQMNAGSLSFEDFVAAINSKFGFRISEEEMGACSGRRLFQTKK